MKKVLSIFLSVTLILGLVISTPSQVKAATINAEYLEHGDGIIYPTGGTIEQCTAIPDDGKFVQMGPNSWITLRFPGNYAAVPDGTSAADLRIDTYDVPYRADAEILVSLNGTNWISVGLWPDTANIDLDLAGVDGPVKYVKIDQGSNYIDPAYPTLGFDLDAVVALNAGIIPYGEILSPDADAVIVIGLNPYDEFIDFDAIYWDDDFDNVQWAVRRASSVPNNPNTVWGNVDGRNDPFDWDGHIFHSTADATTWLADLYYAFVWNPVEDVGEPNIRLVRSFRIDAWPTVDSISSPNVTSLDVNITVSATGSDPDGDVLSYSWDFDNDEEFDDAVGPAPLFPAGSVPRIQTIKVKVEDPYGAYAIGQTEVVVNACPTVSIAGPYLTAVDTTIQLEATGYDPGPEPIDLSYAWDFDNDGEFDDATGATTDYTAGLEAGIYSVSVRVTDQYNCSDEVETTVVVYDPDGGFVTGGGWIYSQPGAYLEDPEMEGKATFGFVSKYQKKSTIPLGNTEFQFHAGDLNFKSSSYEWLIINQGGTNAQFKGYGTINGQGSYMFMIWATDDSVDTFRIKIENTADGTIVYDNGAQELCKGSIVIHTK